MKAYVFPGQGTQFVGMWHATYSAIPVFEAMMEEACQILGYDIKHVMSEGPATELNRTEVSQPAIFLLSCCLLQQTSGKVDAVAGHSLGEYTALVADGVMDFTAALRLVQARAEAMQRASLDVPGAMAAVIGLGEARLNDICAEMNREGGAVWVANLNSPEQIVISGQEESVGEAMSRALSAGAKRVKKLTVGVASHTPLMQSAAVELEKTLAEAPMRETTIPIYMNVDGRPRTSPPDIKDALLRQLTHPVRWVKTIHYMEADGIHEFVEVGPGSVFRGLIRKIAPTASIEGVVVNLPSKAP